MFFVNIFFYTSSWVRSQIRVCIILVCTTIQRPLSFIYIAQQSPSAHYRVFVWFANQTTNWFQWNRRGPRFCSHCLHTTELRTSSLTKQQTGSNEKEGGRVFVVWTVVWFANRFVTRAGRRLYASAFRCSAPKLIHYILAVRIYALGQPYRFKPGKRQVPGCNVNGSGSSNLLILPHYLFGSRTNSFFYSSVWKANFVPADQHLLET